MTDRLAYRIAEAAEAARVSRATIYRLIAAGQLKTTKIGTVRLVPAKALHALIEKGANRVP